MHRPDTTRVKAYLKAGVYDGYRRVWRNSVGAWMVKLYRKGKVNGRRVTQDYYLWSNLTVVADTWCRHYRRDLTTESADYPASTNCYGPERWLNYSNEHGVYR